MKNIRNAILSMSIIMTIIFGYILLIDLCTYDTQGYVIFGMILFFILSFCLLILKDELPIVKQIFILEKVKEINERDGLCLKILKVLRDEKINDSNIYISDIKYYIPSFTKHNCIKLSSKYNFKCPKEYGRMWWDYIDNDERLKCLDALITELKNKL